MFQRFGLALRILRELSGLSQAALARKARVGKSQLSKYESGKDNPKLSSLEKLLRAMNVRPVILFHVAEWLDRIAQQEIPSILTAECEPLMNENERDGYAKVLIDLTALFEAQIERRVRSAIKEDTRALLGRSE